ADLLRAPRGRERRETEESEARDHDGEQREQREHLRLPLLAAVQRLEVLIEEAPRHRLIGHELPPHRVDVLERPREIAAAHADRGFTHRAESRGLDGRHYIDDRLHRITHGLEVDVFHHANHDTLKPGRLDLLADGVFRRPTEAPYRELAQ